MKNSANNAMDRNLHPRHASCVRTCRAGVPVPVMADVRAQTRISEREVLNIDRGRRLAADAA
jgi:hypothetical protein